MNDDEVQQKLVTMADLLAGTKYFEVSWREHSLAQLYAPFIRQLAEIRGFCHDLANLAWPENPTAESLRSLLYPLIENARLPVSPLFSKEHWATILVAAVKVEPMASLMVSPLFVDLFQIELIYRPWGTRVRGRTLTASQRGALPLIEEVRVGLARNSNREVAKRKLTGACRPKLNQLKRRAKQLLPWLLELRAIEVRLFTGAERDDRPGQIFSLESLLSERRVPAQEMLACFTVDTKMENRIKLLDEIVKKVLDELDLLLHFSGRQGRPYASVDVAPRWRRHVVDGKTIRQIAEEEAQGSEDLGATLENTISREFKAFGITSPKK